MDRRDFHLLALYEFKLGHESADAAHNLRTTFGEDAPEEKTVREWFTRFLAGDENFEELKRVHRSSSSGSIPERLDDFVKKLMEPQHGKSWSEVVKELGTLYNTMWNHSNAKKRKTEPSGSHELTERYLQTRLEADPDAYQNKILLQVWWSAAGLIHHRFLGPGQEITTESFNKELELVHERLQTQQPAPSHRKNPIFLYDTSRPHVEKTTLQKLHRLGVEVLPHPSYSPDLLPTEFHFFHALDKFIKEKRFRDGDELKDAFKQFLDSLDSDFYKDGVSALISRWEKCVEHNGAYF
ncbi:transposase [Ancylostoma caninum]|uniref:Transposase n=1 Tax=Ancylostoma caninum TaxID=29170 RepID=A0A368FGD7_ANCCA|nr:transposase [Ancylostoma caninum]